MPYSSDEEDDMEISHAPRDQQIAARSRSHSS